MADKIFYNNQVSIAGEITSDFTFSHEVFGEGFYLLEVTVARLSNTYDLIPVMVSERLIDVKKDYKGKLVEVIGQFRSYNRHEENKNKLVLSVFARDIRIVDQISENFKTNHIFLDGYVCKPPVYRKTPWKYSYKGPTMHPSSQNQGQNLQWLQALELLPYFHSYS